MTLRRWRKAGKLKASHLGRGVRYSSTEIERIEREAQV
jgi:predicted site-specific integrase-resolvase